jgi:hypothetical protein
MTDGPEPAPDSSEYQKAFAGAPQYEPERRDTWNTVKCARGFLAGVRWRRPASTAARGPVYRGAGFVADVDPAGAAVVECQARFDAEQVTRLCSAVGPGC